jgi:CubicO group peptidase (beta-lactamase class C family)
MRAGYLWGESSLELFDLMSAGFRPSNLVDIPLTGEPGARFDDSNLTSHLQGIILARACEKDLKSFAHEYLFSPLRRNGFWTQDC